MDDLKSWLVSDAQECDGRVRLGEPLFAEMLKATEQVDVPLADLAATGRADLERTRRH